MEAEYLNFDAIIFDMDRNKLSHIADDGRVKMVDVSAKPIMNRKAIATAKIYIEQKTLDLITKKSIPKGNVFETARIAGIQATKKTGEWIPLCHPLPIEFSDVEFEVFSEPKPFIEIKATAAIQAKTGIEMEALTAVSAAALTIYDMCKAVDKSMTISDIKLIAKTKSPV